jgi:hypothetical protein
MSAELRNRREDFLRDADREDREVHGNHDGSEADESEFHEAKIVVKGGTHTALCALIANLEGNLMRTTQKRGSLEREVDSLETKLRYNVLELNNEKLTVEELRKFHKEAWGWRGLLTLYVLLQIFRLASWVGLV